jgi:hypothetical protein
MRKTDPTIAKVFHLTLVVGETKMQRDALGRIASAGTHLAKGTP